MATASASISAIPVIPVEKVFSLIEKIKEERRVSAGVSTDGEFSLYFLSLIVGSYVCKVDIDNPSMENPRNHEYCQFADNLLRDPGLQLSPSILEYLAKRDIKKLNIIHHMFLIDPEYSRKEHAIPYGLVSKNPSLEAIPIIATKGRIVNYDLYPFEYNSFLEPYIIPQDVSEELVMKIIQKFQFQEKGKFQNTLINIMDCTSNTLRKLWMHNTAPNVFLAMPDCLLNDKHPGYKPICTVDETCGLRWMSWHLDKDLVSVAKYISPHTYEFLIHNYKRMVMERYFIPISKILKRMRVSMKYTFNGKTLVFANMCFPQFRDLWFSGREEFANLFLSYMDRYFIWNYYQFIDILLVDNIDNVERSMQKILLEYVKQHITQLKLFFPDDHMLVFEPDELKMQQFLDAYLPLNNVH